MLTVILIFLTIVCILLMAVVLMQSSKGGGLAATFGGSQVTTMFGARRASDFLSKSTIVLAVIFMLFSLLVNLYISKRTETVKSVLQETEQPIQQQQVPQTLPPGELPTQENQPGEQHEQPQQQNQ